MTSSTPRRRRRVRVGICIATAVLVLIGLAVRDTSPIGHFASGDAKDAFLRSYGRAMAELPEPDETLDVRTGYGVVRVYRFDGGADGAPLVLLPGRAAASPVWAGNLPSLLKVRDVYTVDLLGEPGMSVQDRPIETDADQAQWLHETLRALPEDRVHLLGLSIGGWTAANLATREPAGIASVTLVDPVLVFADMPVEVMVRSIPASAPWLPKSWRDGFNSWTAGGAPVEDVPEADMIESGMRNYTLVLPAPTRIPEERMAALKPPALAVIAGESVMHDSAAAVETAERTLPDGSVALYPDASHALNGEYPDELAADVAAFVDGAEGEDE
ncbi:pimeloyl-ACP methyl ester carboxylesterase [Murinocardiopsis flavida]|uniref:Pimeloyl-ACP methyl ester carboxylesterase n=1 Tax=Murinocardiopsis flavida TaxID=645275 RepID=A0A2P8D3R0_9ACTN|nr:alpha/beta hydrolase [Murinocardiopsis flavida]PSK91844.1 pimeloyl-ACP methyl ester carboxylesterase [Murinocardiopsis flavida]